MINFFTKIKNLPYKISNIIKSKSPTKFLKTHTPKVKQSQTLPYIIQYLARLPTFHHDSIKLTSFHKIKCKHMKLKDIPLHKQKAIMQSGE